MEENPLRPIVATWLKKIELAKKHKKPFTDDAKEALGFYASDPEAMWGPEQARTYAKGIDLPAVRICVNRVWEAVRLFSSVIHHRNPTRAVTPKAYPIVPAPLLGIMPQPPVPQMGPDGPVIGPDGQPVMMPDPGMMAYQQGVQQQQFMGERRKVVAQLLEEYLNYTPNELNLKQHSRKVVEEAFIKGAGVWWHELFSPPGSAVKFAGSFFDSVDNLVWDPDADEFEDIRWCARRRVQPIDEAAAKFGLTRDALKGHLESYDSRVEEGERGYEMRRKNGQTNDIICYWEIYSKTGFGDRLKDGDKDLRGKFDSLGANCYIVVAEGVEFPLNIPPTMLQEPVDETGIPQQMFLAAQWPIPFWAEPAGWPFTLLAWHGKPGYSWPVSLIRPGIGELRFINWAMSFLATRVATSSQTLIGVSKAADPDLKSKLLEKSEKGFNIVEISEAVGRSVNDVISVFQVPGVTQDMYNIIAEVTALFDRRVGLTELVYGMTRNQFRSAAEAQVKAEQISVRPDDYANILEDALSEVARKEALCARWLIYPQDVEPLLGPMAAQAWGMHVQNESPDNIVREYSYRVEAGSARKPNIATRIENITNAMQILAPISQGLLQAGRPELFNALLEDWGKAMQVDVSRYMIPPPPPGPPPQGQPNANPPANQ
ncbi:MAG: hypothetical protein EBT15_09995 [Betaproteobacteria bacterium]|nr:hypothetical protein [Betaproteobacteria bacterium]